MQPNAAIVKEGFSSLLQQPLEDEIHQVVIRRRGEYLWFVPVVDL